MSCMYTLLFMAVVFAVIWMVNRSALSRKAKRQMDVRFLWSACLAQAPTLDHAKAAFCAHAVHDPVWRKDFTEDEIVEIIDKFDEKTSECP